MIKSIIEHYSNPLHIYCRLRDIGISRANAKHLAERYEQTIFKRLSEVLGMGEEKHQKYLNNIVDHLYEVGESREHLKGLLIEPRYYKNGVDLNKMCDMILLYTDKGIPLELKGTRAKKEKAVEQLHFGKRFLQEELNIKNIPYGLFVTYNDNKYWYERVELNGCGTKCAFTR
jgi:hypothetical protein